MKTLLLTFDIEEFNVPKDYGIDISLKEQCRISRQGLIRVLDLLKRTNTKSTFFTTLIFARNEPDLIKRIIKEGHELALHAYDHDHDYTNMPEKESYFYLKKAKDEIEKKFKVKISGFRGPQMRRPSYSLLKKLGISYDSSLHPTFVPLAGALLQKLKGLISSKPSLKTTYLTSYTKNFLGKRNIFRKDGVIIVPLSVSPVVRMPMFWIAFRNLPLSYTKACAKSSLIGTGFLNMYFHPWDFSDLENDKRFSKMFSLITKNTGLYAINKLETFINWTKRNNIASNTISGYLKN